MKKAEYAHKVIKNEKSGKEMSLSEKLESIKQAMMKKETEFKVFDKEVLKKQLETFTPEDLRKTVEDMRKGAIPNTIPLDVQITLIKSKSNEEAIEIIEKHLKSEKEKRENTIRNIKTIFDE